MNRINWVCLGVMASLASAPLYAHHGSAGIYDLKKTVTVKGTVKEFLWRNPHSALFLSGKDAAGKDVTYSLEMGSPVTLVRLGFKRDSFKSGDAVVMEMHPSLTNATSGYSISSQPVTINGKPLRSTPTGASDVRDPAESQP